MDAVQNLFKKTALFLVIALAIVTPGRAAAPVFSVQGTVTLSGSGGQDISVNSTGGDCAAPPCAITFSVLPITYAAGDPSWLSVSPTSGTTPSFLSFFQSGAGALTPGTHTATVTLRGTSPSGVADKSITVSFTTGSGGGGGGSGTISATPNPINLSAAVNSNVSTNVIVTTSSVAPITIQVATSTTNGVSWLSATINNNINTISSGSGTSLTVQANAFGLAGNISYQGTVTITPSSGTALSINVTFNVGGSGGTGTLTANPNPINWNFTSNSGVFPFQSVGLLSSSGAQFYSATATSSNGWLLVGGATSVQNFLISGGMTVQAGSNINALATGTYVGTIAVTDTNGGATTITVNLNVNGGNSSGLSISPNPVAFTSAVGGGTLQQTLTVTSTTGGTMSVTGSSGGWLSWQPNTTQINSGGSGTITVFATPGLLTQNTYLGSLVITVGSQSATVSVTLQVGTGSGGGTGTTSVAPSSLSFTYQTNTPPNFVAQPKIAITGPQGAWTSSIAFGSGTGWLTLAPSSGSSLPDQATVAVTPSLLAVGNYSATITVTTPGGTQNVQVNLSVTTGPVLVPTPGSLIFNHQVGNAAPQGQNVFFSASDASALTISALANDSWITVSATSSSMSIAVDPSGKSAGVYSSSVSVSQAGVSNSPLVIPVVLIVNGGGSGTSGPLTFVPTSMQFNSVNGAIPFSQTLSVTAASQTAFTAVASVQNGGTSWLSVTPTSSSTNANLSVSVNPTGLGAGTYSGTVTFTANGVNQGVSVTLTVSGSGGGSSILTVLPATLSFSGQAGAVSLPAQTLAVSSSTGSAPVGFAASVTSGNAWLTASPGSGTTPLTVTVNVSPTGLSAGTYNGNIQLLPIGGAAVNVPVTVTITAPPTTVSATPATLIFAYRAGDALPASQAVSVTGGGGTLTFDATASSNGNWLSVSPASGTTPATGAATVNVSVNPVSLSAGDYVGTVVVVGTGTATGSTTIQVNLKVTAPLPTITRVTNAGSYISGAIAPGEIVTLFGINIGPVTPAGLALDSSGKVATSIGGVQVLVNGIPAPMVYASATQVSAVVPYELAGFASASVLVRFLGQTSNGVPVSVATTAPGLFTLNASGTGPAAILNPNNSTNSPTNPANRGDTVVVYLTGEGQTSPAGVTGKVTTVAATPPLTPAPLLLVSVLIGGQPANYTFAGEAPGFVSGVLQLNVTTPTNIAAGEQSLVVSIGGNQSQPGVTVSVR